MIAVKRLKEILQELPEDALAYAYEGEVVGIIFVSSNHKELGYIPTKETGSDDFEFIKTE
ncbi:MAG: hypothetical protein L0287_18325 [Anaerolineae bacterium]|nr:hypothetical protein [Anaerolineae bacterium]MCI0607905.1 hypothetical protein [Anaerolineae bacterium]